MSQQASGSHPPTTLITGASSGIGAAIADQLLASGHRVVNVSNVAPAESSDMVSHLADLRDADATRRVLADICASYEIDNLVHCAGIPYMGQIEDFDTDAFQQVSDIHVRAVMQCAAAVVPGMKARGYGRIVSLGSRVSLGRANSSLYGSAKAAVIGMSRGLAVELAPYGITVNVVSPGPVDTTLFRVYHKDGSDKTKALLASIPMGRIAQPADVLNAVCFFLQESSAYVTGQNLFVCGGLDIASASRS